MPSQPMRLSASSIMPALVHTDDASNITVETLLLVLRKRRVRGVIVGGDSPCPMQGSAGREGPPTQAAGQMWPPHRIPHLLAASPQIVRMDCEAQSILALYGIQSCEP